MIPAWVFYYFRNFDSLLRGKWLPLSFLSRNIFIMLLFTSISPSFIFIDTAKAVHIFTSVVMHIYLKKYDNKNYIMIVNSYISYCNEIQKALVAHKNVNASLLVHLHYESNKVVLWSNLSQMLCLIKQFDFSKIIAQ